MDKLTFGNRESYFKKIEQVLIPNWRNEVKLAKKLRQLIDPEKLCSVKVEILAAISQDLEAVDKAELKNQRLEWNTRYSVLKRKKEYNNLVNAKQQLEIQKRELVNEREELENEISFYLRELTANSM